MFLLFKALLHADMNWRAKKRAKREDLRKSVAIARAQLIGTPENESEPAVVQIATDAPLHLLFEHKILMCPVGDPAELYFSLYNGPKNEFVSEEYVVHMTVNGMPEGIIVTHAITVLIFV